MASGDTPAGQWRFPALGYDSDMLSARTRTLLFGMLLLAALHASGTERAVMHGLLYVQTASDPGAAARQAAAMTGGRVLDVQTLVLGGQPLYQVKVLLPDGRLRVVQVQGAAPRGINSSRN